MRIFSVFRSSEAPQRWSVKLCMQHPRLFYDRVPNSSPVALQISSQRLLRVARSGLPHRHSTPGTSFLYYLYHCWYPVPNKKQLRRGRVYFGTQYTQDTQIHDGEGITCGIHCRQEQGAETSQEMELSFKTSRQASPKVLPPKGSTTFLKSTMR